MELGLVHQLFGVAAADGRRLYEVLTCGASAGLVRTEADFPIYAPHGIEVAASADTLIVPASHEQDEMLEKGELPKDLAAALSRTSARVASICTGAFVLAAAGLLDGRRATTHWLSCERFREAFPAVRLDPDVLYTDDGTVLTSAGEASGIDLCLHMIRSDHGAAVANEVARRTVVPPYREGGQAQYVPYPVPDLRSSSTAAARAWALEHLDRPLTLRELASQEALSVRSFTRRFRAEVGVSPAQWLIRQRIERARQLLEETDLSIDLVASKAGFGSAAALRKHMQAVVRVSPRAYRRTFRHPETSGLSV